MILALGDGAQGKLSRTRNPPPAPHPPRPKNNYFLFVLFYFVQLLGSFLDCAPVDGLLHTLALTEKLGKQAKIARARDAKLYFRLFRYVNPCVNVRWSMQSVKTNGGQAPLTGTNPVSLRALGVQTRRKRASWLFHRSRTAWAQDAAGGSLHRVKRPAI